MYYSILEVLKVVGLSFSELSFKLASVHKAAICLQKSSDSYAKQKHPPWV